MGSDHRLARLTRHGLRHEQHTTELLFRLFYRTRPCLDRSPVYASRDENYPLFETEQRDDRRRTTKANVSFLHKYEHAVTVFVTVSVVLVRSRTPTPTRTRTPDDYRRIAESSLRYGHLHTFATLRRRNRTIVPRSCIRPCGKARWHVAPLVLP